MYSVSFNKWVTWSHPTTALALVSLLKVQGTAMVANQKHCYFTDPADKQISGEMLQSTTPVLLDISQNTPHCNQTNSYLHPPVFLDISQNKPHYTQTNIHSPSLNMLL